MYGYIDMHCHILPEVDDGARSTDEMMQMLQIAYDEGIRQIVATPHHHPRRGKAAPEVVRKQAALLENAARSIDEKFRIYLGTEIFFALDVPEKLHRGEILTMGGTSLVLVEFEPFEEYTSIRQGLRKLQFAGYEVILAHVERYDCILRDIDLAEELCRMGVRLQVNAGSIIGESGRKVKKFIRKLMNEDLVFCVGTDAHSAGHRAPRMRKAAEYVSKKYDEEYMRELFCDNFERLLRKKG